MITRAKAPKSWIFRKLQIKMWESCNKLIWGSILFLVLISIFDFLLFKEQYLELILLNIICISLILVSHFLLGKVQREPTLLLHLVQLILNFLLLYSISISNTTGQILYLVLLAISFVSFNIIAIWKEYNAIIQFVIIGGLTFTLDYFGFFDVEKLLLNGGYVIFSLCLISIAFPSIKILSLKDEMNKEFVQSQKISDFVDSKRNLEREIHEMNSKLVSLENKTKIFQHDIKNHLGNVGSLIDLIELEDRYDPKTGNYDYLKLIKKSIKNTSEKNKEFFKNFNKKPAKNIKIEKTQLNLHKIIKDNIYEFIETTISQNIHFEIELKAVDFDVFGEKKSINTAIYNLFKYMVDFSNNNDIIKVSTRNDYSTIILEITNRSTGMSMHKMESYFKSINKYNFEDIQKNKGLGLNIAKTNIELMDGHLRYSASESLGFEFVVEFKVIKK